MENSKREIHAEINLEKMINRLEAWERRLRKFLWDSHHTEIKNITSMTAFHHYYNAVAGKKMSVIADGKRGEMIKVKSDHDVRMCVCVWVLAWIYHYNWVNILSLPLSLSSSLSQT